MFFFGKSKASCRLYETSSYQFGLYVNFGGMLMLLFINIFEHSIVKYLAYDYSYRSCCAFFYTALFLVFHITVTNFLRGKYNPNRNIIRAVPTATTPAATYIGNCFGSGMTKPRPKDSI